MTSNATFGVPTDVPHVEWIDLHNDGVAHEIIILSRNINNGDLYFIAMQDLDQIDRLRMARVLRKKDAGKLPLWELLSNETLKNGMNALDFFHQLAKLRTVNGKVFSVDSNRRGAPGFAVNPLQAQANAKVQAQAQEAAKPKAKKDSDPA